MQGRGLRAEGRGQRAEGRGQPVQLNPTGSGQSASSPPSFRAPLQARHLTPLRRRQSWQPLHAQLRHYAATWQGAAQRRRGTACVAPVRVLCYIPCLVGPIGPGQGKLWGFHACCCLLVSASRRRWAAPSCRTPFLCPGLPRLGKCGYSMIFPVLAPVGCGLGSWLSACVSAPKQVRQTVCEGCLSFSPSRA